MIDKKRIKKSFLNSKRNAYYRKYRRKAIRFCKKVLCLTEMMLFTKMTNRIIGKKKELRKQLDEQVHDHHHHLEEIEALNFNPSQVVEPGAVIKVNDNYMVIATADGNFTFEGKNFISISDKSAYLSMHDGQEKRRRV